MTIISFETLYDHKRLTTDNFTAGADLYEQDWHAIRINTDRIMSKFEIENTPEWDLILEATEDHTIIYQSPTYTERLYKMAITAVTPDLVSRLKGILNQLGLDVKALTEADALLQQNQGNLTALDTTDKSNIVAAINEVRNNIPTVDLTALLDDENVSTDTAYSSQKIVALINASIDGVVNGASGTMNTLSEIEAAIGANSDVITTINNLMNNVVRFDVAQSKSATEQAQARSNVGAASEADLTQLAANVGDIDSLSLADYTTSRDA